MVTQSKSVGDYLQKLLVVFQKWMVMLFFVAPNICAYPLDLMEKGKVVEWRGRQRSMQFLWGVHIVDAFLLFCFWQNMRETGRSNTYHTAYCFHATLKSTFGQAVQRLIVKAWCCTLETVSVSQAPIFLTSVLLLCLFPGGRCHRKAIGREREKRREKKIIWRHSAALAPSSFVPHLCKNSYSEKKKPLTKKKTGERCRAAGRGGHLTDKTRELCSRIPTVLYTELRDWSLQAEGGERREGRKVGEKERGRGGNSVQC